MKDEKQNMGDEKRQSILIRIQERAQKTEGVTLKGISHGDVP